MAKYDGESFLVSSQAVEHIHWQKPSRSPKQYVIPFIFSFDTQNPILGHCPTPSKTIGANPSQLSDRPKSNQ
jgi:hypothetical protein